MSFRGRLLIAFAAATLVPLALLATGVRRQIVERLTAQHQRRVEVLARVATQDLAREHASIDARLRSLAASLADDNRFRLAVSAPSGERAWLLDWAADAMRVTGLSMLQLQDDDGRILSSGHFRNEFDRLDAALPRALADAGDSVSLVATRTPEGRFLALARVDSLRLGDRRFTLVGGTTVDRGFLARFARDDELSVTLLVPDGVVTTDSIPRANEAVVSATLPLRYVDTRAGDSVIVRPAQLAFTHSTAALEALVRSVGRWFAGALVVVALAALALALWLSASLSRPVAELARAASSIDLEGPDIAVTARRDDEIGTLARRFNAMVRRLRASAARLREAERRATVGDLARQVNHDIKNGLVPIRNVMRHLVEVQEQRPAELPGVFGERRATIESSVAYLETLARNYARLSPQTERRAFDANAVVRDTVAGADAGGSARIETRLAESLPSVLGDPLVFRRIVDNLLRNALESLPATGGTVRLETSRLDGGAVRLVVADTGRGMEEHELDRAFDDFYTTKSGGTGLGLSVVRRLTADLQGTLRVTSEPGRGTTFMIDLPSASGAPGSTPRAVPATSTRTPRA